VPAKYVCFQGSYLDPTGVEDAMESHSAYRAAALLSLSLTFLSPEITRKLTWKPLVMKLFFIAKTKYTTITELHLHLNRI